MVAVEDGSGTLTCYFFGQSFLARTLQRGTRVAVSGVFDPIERKMMNPLHEVLADGIDAANELVWLWNSWGTAYALGGRFCMSYRTWEQLLSRQGDVTVPVT